MLGDARSQRRELQHLAIGQRSRAAALVRERHPLDPAVGGRHDAQALVGDVTLDDGAAAAVDAEAVGRHHARDQRLPEAEAGVDDGGQAVTGNRIGREQDARHVGVDHLLHHHGEGHLAVVEPVTRPVEDGALGEQGGPAAAYRVQQGALAADVEVGVLLACEGRARQVLGRGAGAHRVGAVGARLPPGALDVTGQLVGDRCRLQHGAQPFAHGAGTVGVVVRQRRQRVEER